MPESIKTESASNGVHDNKHNNASGSLDASRLEYTFTNSLRAIPAPNSPELWAQGEATDHMILARYDVAKGGWQAPELVPYGPLTLMPTASTLHYATECFEGMKLYRGNDGRARLFRPERNAKRMVTSAARVSLPEFPPDELVKLIHVLAAIDAPRWLPADKAGGYLYVRPTFIATQPSLAVKKASEALLYVILVCFPAFDDPAGSLGPGGNSQEKRAGLRLLASEEDMVRAWPGGFGNSKVGASYGPSIVASAAAAAKGFDQILWLFGKEGWVTEAGACNFFAIMKERGGDKAQLITAPLEDQVILPGVTRASVLETAQEILAGELDVVERKFSIHELIEAVNEDRLVECFACGTAFFIAPIGEIHYKGQSIEVPLGEDGLAGEYAKKLRARLGGIMHGDVQHPWGYKIEETGPTKIKS
ncbi:uncharacterized protein TRUGW13939_10578 [Talaromyces rugulosus]|uniref:Branched-chain-amino-acid aminotransferase n=1 Tax=Talaromyces rugulosus TaxID=121627 RepID=A0A7H8RBL2_TALRU|nr:uncharacterized protein TRUGW13939_10578 [Talaromyces rugulosus]QKX63408.1 hypothetical protein TRUGW13939_10578 [Talaromyces rugulosus]